jgi:hypothetical protein
LLVPRDTITAGHYTVTCTTCRNSNKQVVGINYSSPGIVCCSSLRFPYGSWWNRSWCTRWNQ